MKRRINLTNNREWVAPRAVEVIDISPIAASARRQLEEERKIRSRRITFISATIGIVIVMIALSVIIHVAINDFQGDMHRQCAAYCDGRDRDFGSLTIFGGCQCRIKEE